MLAVIIIAGIAGGASNSGNTASSGGTAPALSAAQSAESRAEGSGQQTEAIAYTPCGAADLFDALKKNALSAKQSYAGQSVELTGYLGTIDASGKYIGIGAAPDDYDYLLQEVPCYLKSDQQRWQVASMNRDDPITVRGKITSVGEVLGYSPDIDSID